MSTEYLLKKSRRICKDWLTPLWFVSDNYVFYCQSTGIYCYIGIHSWYVIKKQLTNFLQNLLRSMPLTQWTMTFFRIMNLYLPYFAKIPGINEQATRILIFTSYLNKIDLDIWWTTYHLPNMDNRGHLANYHLPHFVHVVIEQPQRRKMIII